MSSPMLIITFKLLNLIETLCGAGVLEVQG